MNIRKSLIALSAILAAGFVYGYWISGLLNATDSVPRKILKNGGQGPWRFAGWYGGGAFPSLVCDPNVQGRVYLTSDVAGLWRSDDRGETWTFKNKGLANLHVPCLAVAPSNSNVVYIGTKSGLMRSDDAGQTWKALAASRGKMTFKRPDNHRALFVDPSDARKLYAGTDSGGVYFSLDGGDSFQSLGLPFENKIPITAVYASADGQWVFAGSQAQGLARRSRQTGVWTLLSGASAQVFDIVGTRAPGMEKIYVTSGNKIAVTSDHGGQWTFTAAIPNSSGFAYRLSVQGDKILVGWRMDWNGAVYMTTDGNTWVSLSKKPNHDYSSNPTRGWHPGMGSPLAAQIDPFTPSTLYFTDWWGVLRSDDDGRTWNEKIAGAPNTVGSQIAVTADGSLLAATMDNGLLRTKDGGDSYECLVPRERKESETKGHIWRVLAQENGRTLIATNSPWDGTANQVLRSEDAGESWTVHRDGLPAAYPTGDTVWDKGYARALAADPNDPNTVYLGIDGNDGGLFVSKNGGRNWTRSPGQPASLRIYNGLAADPAESSRIYWAAAGPDGGVFRSQDGGKNWTRVFSESTWVFDLAVSSSGKIYAAAAPASLYVSGDHGATWNLLKKFPGSGTCEAITLDPSRPGRIFAATVEWNENAKGRIFYSSDYGAEWKEITDNLPDNNGGVSMAVDGPRGVLYLMLYAGSVYKRLLSTL